MSRRSLLVVVMVAGCTTGEPPDLIGLTDQVAVVGQPFTLELEGVDPDGDLLTYTVHANIALGGASVTKQPSGRGVFRWTPLATDVGMHVFDFTVSDGNNDTTVSIEIDVRTTSAGSPIFRQPLGTGRVVNLAKDPCMVVDIVVEDQDTAQVTIAEDEPLIAGALFDQTNGTTASWMWCPTPAQVAESPRYTLVLSADDGENPKTIKHYVIALGLVAPGLIINEVDYDQLNSDTTEYLELHNPSSATTSLAGLAVVFVNGATSATYQTVDLSPLGSLAAGQYLVIAGASVSVPASALKLDPVWTQDHIQNGAPDGVAIIDTVGKTVVDALSYEGSITAAMIPDFAAPVSLVEGMPLDPAVADENAGTKTLCRPPGQSDTNNATTDWGTCGTRTVGTANAL